MTKDWKTKTETHDCFAYCLLPCYKRVRGIQQNHTFYLMDVYVISEGNVKGRIVQILRVSCVLVCFLSICLVLFEFILCNRSSVLHCRLCSYCFSLVLFRCITLQPLLQLVCESLVVWNCRIDTNVSHWNSYLKHLSRRCLKADSLIRKFGEAIKTKKIPSLVFYFIINNKTRRTVDFLN